MDYKKELEEIKQRVYNIATGTADVNYCNAKEIAEYIDPTLKRSEDEVMYDKLMHALNALVSYIDADAVTNEAQKPILFGEIENIRKWLAKKNLTDTTFKPRFKVGDWITNGFYAYLIKEIDTYGNVYIAENKHGEKNNLVFSYYDKNFHLWTINDAKRGDVLCCDNDAFIFSGELEEGRYPFAICGKNSFGNFCIPTGEKPWIHSDVYPATKAQRDSLSRMIRESGYIWIEGENILKRRNGGE